MIDIERQLTQYGVFHDAEWGPNGFRRVTGRDLLVINVEQHLARATAQ